jgi:long-chain acyl-CoA synthetase
MVLRLAASLLRLGIREGDRVVLYLFNMPQTIIAWLALDRLGAIVVPVAPVYSSQDLRYLVNDAGAETIFCMDSNFNYVNEILGKTPLQRVIVTNMLDLVSGWKRLVARGFDRVPRGSLLRESIFPISKIAEQWQPSNFSYRVGEGVGSLYRRNNGFSQGRSSVRRDLPVPGS